MRPLGGLLLTLVVVCAGQAQAQTAEPAAGRISANRALFDAVLAPDAQALDGARTRGWPSVWTLSAGRYALDVSPHAALGAGGAPEAGATVRLSAAELEERVMRGLGLRVAGGSGFTGQGRWFLFAAASGRAVGLNMLPTEQGGVQRAGWSMEPSSILISDAQAGLGWRKGSVQASLGYVHRAVRSEIQMSAASGPANYHDSMVALSFSFTSR